MNLEQAFEMAEMGLNPGWMIELEIYNGSTTVNLIGPRSDKKMPLALSLQDQIMMAVDCSHETP